ncbi:MAG: trigger factor family protein [Gemmatimonadales bacterium]
MSTDSDTPTDPPTAAPSIHSEAHEESAIARRVEVRVAAARVKQAFDSAYRDLARQAQLKGFRRGKAPRSVLERLYGRSVAEDVRQKLVMETLGDAIEQEPYASHTVLQLFESVVGFGRGQLRTGIQEEIV